jgi:hypothetical protein
MVDVLKSDGSPSQIGTDAMRRGEIGTLAQAIWPAGSSYADLLLELHAYFAFSMLALVALHIGNALHDDMMRAPGDGATRKN